jgi:hypothetical protein
MRERQCSRSPLPGTRAQTEPLVALVALFAVSVGVSLYAGALDDVSTTVGVDRDVATPTLERVHDATSTAGVVDPSARASALDVGPDGYDLHVTVRAAETTWHAGPPVPTPKSSAAVDSAVRSISVRVAPGRVRPGRLRVVVWT